MDYKSDGLVRVNREDYIKEKYKGIVFFVCVKCDKVERVKEEKISTIFRYFCPSCKKVLIGDYVFTPNAKIINISLANPTDRKPRDNYNPTAQRIQTARLLP